jgi:RNA polymerase sigma factor (sigma-70 family)
MIPAKLETNNDELLIKEAIEGNKRSLEILIMRYQDYIYNISLRLFLNPDDALDATQEVLIKVVTHLKTFNGKSKFSTWLYRIAVNHFLNSPMKKMETIFNNRFTTEALVELYPESEESYPQDLLEEVRVACSTAMLMCLSRDQRLIYIMGEILGADHSLGAELFETTPANYRIKLHRAKTDLLNFVSGRCGLVNPKNSCRCNKKTKWMIEKGYVNKEKFVFTIDFQTKINQIVNHYKDPISDDIQFRLAELFTDSPFQVKKSLDGIFENLAI